MEITNVYGELTREEKIAIKLDCIAKEGIAEHRNEAINLTGRAVEYSSVNSDGEAYNAMLVEANTANSRLWLDISGDVVTNQLIDLFADCGDDTELLSSLNVRFTTKDSKKHNGQSYNILTIGG